MFAAAYSPDPVIVKFPLMLIYGLYNHKEFVSIAVLNFI